MDNLNGGGGSNSPDDYAAGGFSGINLSDVIEVIEHNMIEEGNNGNMVNINNDNQNPLQPYAEIVEQPAPKALRFRYECEGRSAGSIPGINSTSDNKTFPTIQIQNYSGRAVVVVSCVTKDTPHKAHPHSIVGRDGCKKGVCTLEINSEDMKMVFSNLGIQCVKRRDIEEALRVREEIRVDPFRMGFNHKSQPSSIDLNAVRLCFQVFLEGPQRGKFTVPVKPVISDPIFDKKSTSDLVITKVSHCSAFCNGGQETILLCEKVAKDDIQVWFYDDSGWEQPGEFGPSQVHKQVAITFRTPKYHRIDIAEAVRVKMQLRRPSDGATSDSIEFEMLPLSEETIDQKRKRKKSSDESSIVAMKKSPRQDGYFPIIHDPNVKLEPRDQRLSPCLPNFGPYRDPVMTTPSPQPYLSPSPLTINNLMPNGNNPQMPPMMNIFMPTQQQPQQNLMNNFNNSYIPNITAAVPQTTASLMNQPSTSYVQPSLMMANHQNNNLMYGGTTSTAFHDLGLMNQPKATLVSNFNSDQIMLSNLPSDLMNIDNLSGDLKALSFSELLRNEKDA